MLLTEEKRKFQPLWAPNVSLLISPTFCSSAFVWATLFFLLARDLKEAEVFYWEQVQPDWLSCLFIRRQEKKKRIVVLCWGGKKEKERTPNGIINADGS